MISVTSVCNSALIKVGADPISSIAEDTRRAQLLNAIFDQIRDEVMAAHKWNFAIKRVKLLPIVDVPEFEYDFMYDVPNDCLRILGMDDDKIEFVVENKQILTDEEKLNLQYIFRNEDPSSWSAGFAEALAWRLAQEISYALTNSSERTQICEQAYRRALSEARSIDGAEGIVKGLVADIFTNARR